MSSRSTPEISVVIVVGSQRKRAANALASVLAQAEIERAEIILIDVEVDHFPPLVGSDHPQVRTIQLGYELNIGTMRSYGARVARSPVVAYLEEHSLALPGWLKETLATFEGGDWAAVGGPMLPAKTEPELETLLSLTNFFKWREDSPCGEIDFLPGHNSAYRRDPLLSLGNDLDEIMLIEMAVQSRLREQGYKLYFENRIRWIHLHENRIDRLFSNYFCWNLMFGRQRVAGRSLAYRVLRIMTTPLILPVRLFKSLLRIGGHAGSQWPAYLSWIPFLVVIHLADTLGMGLGYLGVWKNAVKVLTIGELAMERQPAPPAYDLWRAQDGTESVRVARVEAGNEGGVW